MSFGGDAAGLPQMLQLVGLLEQAQTMGSALAPPGPGPFQYGHRCRATPGRKHLASTDAWRPTRKAIASAPVILRQFFTQLIQRMSNIRAIALNRSLRPPAKTGPNLSSWILADEQHKTLLRPMRQQQGHRIRFIKPREVKKVTVLSKGPLAVGVVGRQGGGRNTAAAAPSCSRNKARRRAWMPESKPFSSREFRRTGWQLSRAAALIKAVLKSV